MHTFLSHISARTKRLGLPKAVTEVLPRNTLNVADTWQIWLWNHVHALQSTCANMNVFLRSQNSPRCVRILSPLFLRREAPEAGDNSQLFYLMSSISCIIYIDEVHNTCLCLIDVHALDPTSDLALSMPLRARDIPNPEDNHISSQARVEFIKKDVLDKNRWNTYLMRQRSFEWIFDEPVAGSLDQNQTRSSSHETCM